jgi:lysophospholipase L1-like esterase
MRAKHGFAVSFRNRGRMMGCLMALSLALSALVFAPAAANAAGPAPGGPTYIALGDSESYGYSAQRFKENYPVESPSRFEEGFVNLFNKDLNKTYKGITPVNLSCPGETSNGLIGEDTAFGGQLSTELESPPASFQGPGDWHPCAYHNAEGFPLHASYGKHSQLEDALDILNEVNPITGKPTEVKAITFQIGANDLFGLKNQCIYEVTKEFTETGKSKYGETPEFAVTACIYASVSTVTIPDVLNNTADVLKVLDTEGHYTGPIVVLGFYNPLTFVKGGFPDLLATEVNKHLEEITKEFPNVTFANPFPVFNKKKKGAAEEQEKICKYTEMCNPNVQEGGTPTGKDGDIHPSLEGHKAIAKLLKQAWEANPAK